MKEYVIIAHNMGEELERIINNHLSIGWELYGNPFHIPAAGGCGDAIGQAMIREKPENQPVDDD